MKPSAIFLARTGDIYRIKTPGWQRSIPAKNIRDILALAWMQYGDNPAGCEVVGTTDGLESYIDELRSGKSAAHIHIRVGHAEKVGIERAAKSHGSVSAYLLSLHRQYGPASEG